GDGAPLPAARRQAARRRCARPAGGHGVTVAVRPPVRRAPAATPRETSVSRRNVVEEIAARRAVDLAEALGGRTLRELTAEARRAAAPRSVPVRPAQPRL